MKCGATHHEYQIFDEYFIFCTKCGDKVQIQLSDRGSRR